MGNESQSPWYRVSFFAQRIDGEPITLNATEADYEFKMRALFRAFGANFIDGITIDEIGQR